MWTWGSTWVVPVLNFLVHSLMHTSAQSNSFNSGPDATLECTLHGGVNVVLDGEPQSSL